MDWDSATRQVSIVFCFLLLTASFAPFTHLSPVGTAKASGIVLDDFEDGTAWSEATVTTSPAYQGTYAMQNTCCSDSTSIPSAKYDSFTYNLYLETTENNIYNNFDSSGSTQLQVRYGNGEITGYNGNVITTVTTGVWYEIVVKNIDYSTGDYTIVVYNAETGKKVGEGPASAPGPLSAIDGLGISGSSNGNVYYDNFRANTTSEFASSTVSGAVTDTSGNPISNVNIEITDTSDGSTVFTGTTDASGAWSTELADGNYRVTASASGYNDNSKTFTVSGSSVSISQTLSETKYSVSGVTLDSSGNPVGNVKIEVQNDTGVQTTLTSSSDGSYSVNLANGSYTFAANKSGYHDGSIDVTVSGSALSDQNITLGENVISGRVLDGAGNPVDDATVTLWLVNDANTTVKTGETLEEAQEKTVETLSRAVPRDLYEPSLDPLNADKFTGKNAGKQVLVHSTGAWYREGNPIGPFTPTYAGTRDLSRPIHQLEPNTEYAFSIWDRTRQPTLEDGIDDKINPGVSSSGTIVVEKIGPGNSTVSRLEVNTTDQISAGVIITKKHDYAALSLPTGYYKIYPESGGIPMIYRVGSPEKIPRTIRPDLKTANETVSKISQAVQDRIKNGVLKRAVVTTDSSGNFSYTALTEYSTVSITAFDGMGLTEGISEPTLGDLRSQIQRQDYNGSIYLSTSPEVVHPPKKQVTIHVTEVSNPSMQDLSQYLDQLEWLRNLTDSESFLEVASLFNDPTGTVPTDTLQNRSAELQKLVNQNEELQQRVKKLLNRNPTITKDYTTVTKEIIEQGLNRTEVKALLEAQRDALMGNESALLVRPPGEVNLDTLENGTTLLSTRFPVEAATLGQTTSVTENGTEILVHWANGESVRMSDEYWRIENGATDTGTAEIVIEEFPIPESASVAKLDLWVANSAGHGRGSTVIENPAVESAPPDLASINLNTMRPGPSETVKFTVTPSETSAFKKVAKATVWHNGTTVSTTVSKGTVSFETSGAGSYLVELNVSDGNRHYIEAFRVEAGTESVAFPASVRVHNGVLGRTLLVGDGVKYGRLSVESGGSVVRITAAVDGEDVPNEIHAYTRGLTGIQREVTVAVVSASDESQVEKPVRVKIHTSRLAQIAHVRINGHPVTSEGNQWGERRPYSGSTLIVTNLRDGSVTASINNNPGLLAKFGWWFDNSIAPLFPLSIAPAFPSPGPSPRVALSFLAPLGLFAVFREVGV